MGLDEIVGTNYQAKYLNDKRTKCEIPCPLRCGKTAVLAWLGGELKAATHGDCTPAKIKAALASKPPEPEPPPRQERPKSKPRAETTPNDPLRRPPPQNIEAEQAVLGAVFLDNESLSVAKAVIQANDFHRETHGLIFQAMCDLTAKGRPVDVVTLKQILVARGQLEACGGISYMAELADITPTSQHQKHYAEIVRDMAVKRSIATITAELGYMANNGVSAAALIGEFQRRALSLDRSVMPIPTEIPWESFDDAIAANDEYMQRRPVIESLCYSSAVSMITGGKHAGKSTLARWMAVCVAKGWQFLGRDVTQGPVFYIASEDETMAARQELVRLGWTPSDPIRFFSASKMNTEDVDVLALVTKAIRQYGVVLTIVDMLFDFIRVGDEMKYAETRRAVGEIQNVATMSESHVCVIHHAPKNANIGDAAVAALGSQGLAARVSPIILVRRFGPGVHSVSSTEVRDPRGKSIVDSRLTRHEDGSMELGGAFKNYMLAEVYAERVLDLLQAEDGSEMTAIEVSDALDISYQVAKGSLAFLTGHGKIYRSGEGKKGKPFRYSTTLSKISPANTQKADSVSGTSQGEAPKTESSEQAQNEPPQGRFGYKD